MTSPLVNFRWTPANVSVTQATAMLPVLIAVWATHGPAGTSSPGAMVGCWARCGTASRRS